MTATNEQLVDAYLTMTTLMATMLEFQATTAEILIPLAENLTDEQKGYLAAALIDGRRLAAQLRESAIELRQS
ncbi:MAG: hypothetical protein ACLQSR_18405 [Limisphaerales bacterium]